MFYDHSSARSLLAKLGRPNPEGNPASATNWKISGMCISAYMYYILLIVLEERIHNTPVLVLDLFCVYCTGYT